MKENKINFDFRDFDKALVYLKDNPYPIDYIVKKHKKDIVNNEFYAASKGFQHINDKGVRTIFYKAFRDYLTKKHRLILVKEYPSTFFIWNGIHYTDVDISYFMSLFENKIIRQDDLNGLSTKEINTFKFQYELVERETLRVLLRKNKGKLPFKNGVLDTSTMSFVPHSSDYFFRFCLPYPYEISGESNTKNWDKLLDVVLMGNESLKKVIEFYLGYILSQETAKSFQYFLLLIGEGNNGKTFFIDVIRNMFTSDLYTTMELSEMGINRFASASLENKILILNDDVSEDIFRSPDFIKRLVGGAETITVEKKNVDPYEIEVVAKPIISTNKVPYLPDISKGFQRRFLPIPFNADINKIPKDRLVFDRDGKKTMFMKEYPYIIKRCLEAYHKQKTDPKKIEDYCSEILDTRRKIVASSNSLVCWFDEKLYYDGDVKHNIMIKDLYSLYTKHFDNNYKYQKKFSNFITELDQWSTIKIKDSITKETIDSAKKLGVFRAKTAFFDYFLDVQNDDLHMSFIPKKTNAYSFQHVSKRNTGNYLCGFHYVSDQILLLDKEEDLESEEIQF